MALVVMHSGSLFLLDALVAGELTGADLHAYSNVHTPLGTDTLSNYTETTFSGYLPITLGSWGASFLNGSNKAETDHPDCTWTVAAGGVTDTITGIYVTDLGGNLLYAEENPAGATLMAAIGQFFIYTPKFTLKSEF